MLKTDCDYHILARRAIDLFKLLQSGNILPLSNKRILEVGCGGGGVLDELLKLGAIPGNLHGVDISSARNIVAKKRLPEITIINADGAMLPYSDYTFDIVMQFTMFSSNISDNDKRSLANEMVRVVKPDGVILWYDFIFNPINRATRGIGKSEIKMLFDNCNYEFRRITLAPPLSRRIYLYSPQLCLILEKMLVMNTHYLATIKVKNILTKS